MRQKLPPRFFWDRNHASVPVTMWLKYIHWTDMSIDTFWADIVYVLKCMICTKMWVLFNKITRTINVHLYRYSICIVPYGEIRRALTVNCASSRNYDMVQFVNIHFKWNIWLVFLSKKKRRLLTFSN